MWTTWRPSWWRKPRPRTADEIVAESKLAEFCADHDALWAEATTLINDLTAEAHRRGLVCRSIVETVDEMTTLARQSDLPTLVDDLLDLRLIALQGVGERTERSRPHGVVRHR